MFFNYMYILVIKRLIFFHIFVSFKKKNFFYYVNFLQDIVIIYKSYFKNKLKKKKLKSYL